MTALLVVLMVLVPILVAPAPVLAHEAGARTSQTIPVDVEVAIEGEPFLLFGVSRLQARVTDERGGTRVEGVIDWHDVALTGVVSENMAHGTNNLHFSYWTDTSPPFAFNLATAQMEQDGIFYYLGHGDGNHGLMVSNPLPVDRRSCRRNRPTTLNSWAIRSVRVSTALILPLLQSHFSRLGRDGVRRLRKHLAAVNGNRLARDVAGFVAGQERRGVANVLR